MRSIILPRNVNTCCKNHPKLIMLHNDNTLKAIYWQPTTIQTICVYDKLICTLKVRQNVQWGRCHHYYIPTYDKIIEFSEFFEY